MNDPSNLILKSVAGSHLYGLNTPSSDLDIRGIYLERIEDVLNISGRQNTELADEHQDEKYYSLGKFLKLASECNPSIIELLWLPEDAILFSSPIYDEIVSRRDWFMSKRALHAFKGYAYAQVKRAKSLHKKGNSVSKYVDATGAKILRMFLEQPFSGRTRIPDAFLNEERIQTMFGGNFLKWLKKERVPWDEEWLRNAVSIHPLLPISLDYAFGKDSPVQSMLPPRATDFICWYRTDENGFPFRQTKFVEFQNRYDASMVEGCGDLCRLYHNGTGFIDAEKMDIVVKSIDKQREVSDFAGVVRINQDEWRKAKREYDSFWEWMANRNEARYSNDWDSEGKVDWKNLMHTMRLLLSAESIAQTGEPRVRFDGADREFLMKIRNGEFSYAEMLERMTKIMENLDGLFEKSGLPEHSDFSAINRFYIDTMKESAFENCRNRRI